MLSTIYPGGMYPVNSVTPYQQKRDIVHPRASEPQYDQAQFSSRMDETERRLRETAGQIARSVRTRPTHQELSALSLQVASGAYHPDPRQIAARMLLREEG